MFDDLKSETIASADASYIIRTPNLKARITGFYSYITGATETSFFFADGVDDGNPDTTDENSSFVAETVKGLNKKNLGVEFGLEYQITKTLKASLTGSYGEYTYDSTPTVPVSYTHLDVYKRQILELLYTEKVLEFLFLEPTPITIGEQWELMFLE